MSNVRKYTIDAPAPIVASEAPEWIRSMSDHYAKTGMVRAVDAVRLQAEQSGARLTQTIRPGRNDADPCDDE